VNGHAREFVQRVLALFRRRQLDDDLSEELAAHVDIAVADNIRAGMSPQEARRYAMVRLGGIEPTKELHRDARGLPALESIARDVGYAFRTLRRSIGFSVVAVGILALGIGGNTAIFSLVHAVLLRPLPFHEPDRLAVLWADLSATGAFGGLTRVEPAPADYVEWKTRSRSFAEMAALERRVYNVTGEGEPEKLVGLRTTANLFSLLGMQPVVGRMLLPEDEGPDGSPVVVLAEQMWRQRFGADPELVGRSISLNGLPHTVVGVVPGDFQFPDKEGSLWVAASFSREELASRGAHWYVVGRLNRGISLREAQAEMTTVAQRLEEEYPDSNAGVGVIVTSLHEQLSRDVRPALLILLGAVGIVLLITCANVASLLLARGASRQKELALRRALGAGQGRVVRHVLTESIVLAGLGVLLGVALCTVSFEYLARLIPETFPDGTRPHLDWVVLSFTAGTALLTVLLCGAGPSVVAARLELTEALKKGAGRGTATAAGRRLRHALVIGEITLTVVLLVAAGLLLRSYAEVLVVDAGFEPTNLVVAETILPPAKYAAQPSRTAFYHRVLERVHALPGVAAAGYVNYPPMTLKEGRGYLTIEGQPPPPLEERARHVVSWRVVSPRYLSALGVPLIRGRHLDQQDDHEAPPAVIVNQAMARLHWADGDPIGRRIKLGRAASPNPWCTVVGVVGDVRQMGLEVPAEPEVYFSLDQRSGATPFFWPQHLVVRTHGDPLAVVPALRRAVWDVDPDQPVSNIRSMSEILDAELLNRSTQMTLVGTFAALALLLAAVGLYGVLSQNVAQRTFDIGVRIALGAPRARVVGSVVGHALLLAIVGIGLGLAAALALTRVLTSVLFGIGPRDPVTFVAAPALLLIVTVLATYVPARRAASIDPVSALRTE
jgi:putative ABC transport system permease protein